MIDSLLAGFEAALTLYNLLFIACGVALGITGAYPTGAAMPPQPGRARDAPHGYPRRQ